MSLLPDPDALFAVADRIERHASAVRRHAEVLSRSTAGNGWHGTAARTFAAAALEVCLALRRSADGLDAAAGALRRHAAHVRAVVDGLARAAVGVVEVGSVGARVGSSAVQAVTGTAGHVLDAVGV